ncbi:MAG: hypothetical protein ACOX2K_06410 [Bacillota bacterium]|jgi:hypothetical protein
MFKKLWASLAMAVLAASLLSGCASHMRIGYAGAERRGSMTARYAYCRQTRAQTVHLREGDDLTLEYDLKVKSGELALSISDPDGEVVWQGEFDQDARESLTFTAQQDGAYRVQLQVKGARGSYRVSWSN